MPFGRQRLLGVVVEVAEHERARRRSGSPSRSHALEAGATPELVRLGLWVAREYCSTPARGLELVLPPGRRHAPGGSPARDSSTWRRRPRRPRPRSPTAPARVRASARARARWPARPAGAERPASELAAGGVERQTLKRLEARGLVSLRAPRAPPAPVDRRGRRSALRRPQLSARSERALAGIVAALDGDAERELLLTASPARARPRSTSRAAEAALERGRGSIVLVPEIALTPQTVARFALRFGDRVALLHSRLAARRAPRRVAAAARGEARICVGPRSAIFAPVARPRAWSSSTRSTTPPTSRRAIPATTRARSPGAGRPSAAPRWCRQRDPAAGELAGARRGSSCPTASTAARCRRSSCSTCAGARRERARSTRGRPRRSPRSRRAEGKAIVLVNRRGWAPFLSCRSCGRVLELPALRRLAGPPPRARRGAECGWAALPPLRPRASRCPRRARDCGSVALARHGAGTERLATRRARPRSPAAGLPARLRQRGGRRRPPARSCGASTQARVGRAASARRWSPRATTSPTWCWRRPRRRRHPALPRLPRRGAHLRAGRPARRPQRPRRARGHGSSSRRWPPTLRRSATRRAHDAAGFLAGELERRRALRLPAVRAPDPGRARRARGGAAPSGPPARLATRSRAAARGRRAARARRRGFGVRGRERRQLLIKARDREPRGAAVRDAVEGLRGDRPSCGSGALGVDVDPQ